MLVIRLEIWPGGHEDQKRTLGTATIINDDSGDANTGNYHYHVRGKKGATLRFGDGYLLGYKRQRHTPWRIVWEVLDKMFKERDGGR